MSRKGRAIEGQVIGWLRKMGGRGTCPACLHPILSGQKTVMYMGRKHHKRCVVAVRPDKR